jgi:hypothetical protein
MNLISCAFCILFQTNMKGKGGRKSSLMAEGVSMA